MKFKRGNKAAAGVARPNAGRKPDWLKEKCQTIIDREELIDLLGRVARGDDMEQVVTDNGEVLQVPASIKDRLKAIEMLLTRGFGKPDSDVAQSMAPQTPQDSVLRAEQAARLLKELERISA
jgi:hypothetical protein